MVDLSIFAIGRNSEKLTLRSRSRSHVLTSAIHLTRRNALGLQVEPRTVVASPRTFVEGAPMTLHVQGAARECRFHSFWWGVVVVFFDRPLNAFV